MSKCTQGPWEVTQIPKLDDFTGAQFVVRTPQGAPGGIAVVMGGLGDEEEKANATLMAAAPEMADMLLSMFTHVSHGGPTRGDVEKLLIKAGVLPGGVA